MLFEYVLSRILWSPSPHATAELFDELKQGRNQPDSTQAATIGVDIIDEYSVDKYNPQIQDFLSKLPGITTKNIFAIMNHCQHLVDLLEITEVNKHLYKCIIVLMLSIISFFRKNYAKFSGVRAVLVSSTLLYTLI